MRALGFPFLILIAFILLPLTGTLRSHLFDRRKKKTDVANKNKNNKIIIREGETASENETDS